MGSRCDSKRMNVEEDRLSSLPDDLIHKILSFLSIKLAVETSVLSSRWRYIWTSMTCLNFSSKDFDTSPKFCKFVKRVMARRNNQIEVSSIDLEVTFRAKVIQAFIKGILSYAFSHNVQQVNITCVPEKYIELPLSLFSSQSLKHLTLTADSYKLIIMTPPTWELQALTTLNLHCVALYDSVADKGAGLFSSFANLKNLTLKRCQMEGRCNGFNICHPRLSNLTLEDCRGRGDVVTPQLKNLTIKGCSEIHLISTPNYLSSLHYKDCGAPLQFSDDLLHLEKADLCITYPSNAHKIVRLLQQLRSAKFLTLNLELVKFLSSSMELISHEPSPFANLKSLKIYPASVTAKAEEQKQPELTMPTEVKSYLLDSSPGAAFIMISYEEVRAAMNVTSARHLLRELQVLLNQWKENSVTNTSHMKQDKAPMESTMTTMPEQVEAESQLDTKTKWHFWERMTHVNEQFKKGYDNTRRTISVLQKIQGILQRLPKSHRAMLLVSYFSLCAEVEAIMDVNVDNFKIQCDKKPRHLLS